LKGVQYFFDDKGNPKSVLIDLKIKKSAELWEDFLDIMIARKRRNEPTISAEELEKQLNRRDAHRKDVYQ